MARPVVLSSGPVRKRVTRVHAWLARHPRAVTAILLGAITAASLGAGLLVGAWRSVCRNCPSIAQISMWEPKQSSKIYDHDGKLITELFEERRTPVQIETLPEYVKYAFVSVEDKRFYRHAGLDYRRIFGAAIRNVLHGSVTSGGSTITQQLARNMFENIGFEQHGIAGLSRKMKEAKVAREIENVYPKDQILEAYINQVNYGHGWRGIETAALHYFGKPAREVNPAQAAMLAAAVNAPGRYSPFINPQKTLQRRNLVLSLMARQQYISRDSLDYWKQTPLPETRSGADVGSVAPYFEEIVRATLDNRYGSGLYNRGLRIYTTLDLEMQKAATAAMDSGWNAIETARGYRGAHFREAMADKKRKRGKETPYIQGSFIAMDPTTGDVRALIGGRNFRDSKFNRATQAMRQAGSTFKPFVYAAAVASGIPASHIMFDAPLDIPMSDGTVYSPKNYDPDFRGPLTLRDALKHSVNTITVKLGMDVGLETVVQTAKDYGIRTSVLPFPSTSIGAASVIPMEMAAAYTVFANAGVRAEPRYITRVDDAEGRVLWQTSPQRKEVANSQVAAIVRDMMTTVVNNGTGYPARDPANKGLPYSVPAAGKTGTTNDGTDVWFIGFTPTLLATVWFGYDRPRTIVPGASGGRFAAPVWGRFMNSIYIGDKPELPTPATWTLPEGLLAIQVDRETGLLPSATCPANRRYTELFIPGTEPGALCDPYANAGLFGTPLGRPVPDTLQK
ncbi:MAG: PBP1A family penicillin-binding protein [Longimicrobiales bacterium]